MTQSISSMRRRTRDATLFACGGLSAMSVAAVAPSLPELSAHFGDQPNIDLLARLVVSIPTLLLALSGPIVGSLADRIGRRPILIFGILLYAASGALPYILDDLTAILVSRAALGLGMGILFTLPPALLADYYEDIPRRRRAIAIFAGATASGGVVFVLAGGIAADIHWRAPFLLYLSALLFLPSLIATVNEPARTRPVDAQTGTLAPRAQSAKPTPWLTLIAIYAMVVVTGGAFLQMPLNLPFLLVDIEVTQASIAGYAIAWPLLLMAIGGPLFPYLRKHLSNAWIYALIAAGMAIGYLLLTFADSLLVVMIALFCFGVGMSQMFANTSTWLLGLTDPAVRARVLGGLTAAIYAGQFALPFVAQPIIREAGIRTSFAVLCGALLFMAIAAPLVSWLNRCFRRPGKTGQTG
ncbi:MAG: MFS transporter [Alphaproteobacteria bacterium]